MPGITPDHSERSTSAVRRRATDHAAGAAVRLASSSTAPTHTIATTTGTQGSVTSPKASASTRHPQRADDAERDAKQDGGDGQHGRLGGHRSPHLPSCRPSRTHTASSRPLRRTETTSVGEGDRGEGGRDQREQHREFGHSLRVEEAVRHREGVDEAREPLADLGERPSSIRRPRRRPRGRRSEGAGLDAVHPTRRDHGTVAHVGLGPVGDHGHADHLEREGRRVAQRPDLQRSPISAPARRRVSVPSAISSSAVGARPRRSPVPRPAPRRPGRAPVSTPCDRARCPRRCQREAVVDPVDLCQRGRFGVPRRLARRRPTARRSGAARR